jgi:hypothetical protein
MPPPDAVTPSESTVAPETTATPTMSGPPIFVVGCHRSGTTLFRLILDSHPHISCGPETRFLADLEKVTDDDNWPRMGLYGFPREYWHHQVATLFNDFQSRYAARRGKTRWADKTPLYAGHLDYLNALFPDALFINVVRDGRDVARSHRDTWGYRSGLKAIEKWPRYIRMAEAFAPKVGPDRYLEVRYENLVGDTNKQMRQVLDFIGEPWDEAVLHHTEHDHDVMERYDSYTSKRRSQKGEGAVYRSRVGGGRKANDPLMRALLRLRAGKTLQRIGYT